uniref:Uncharacterized protein n=1 Tax=Anguilla anguilla TaxID=7936 RepID=A0A0E9V7X9_ANGAN
MLHLRKWKKCKMTLNGWVHRRDVVSMKMQEMGCF